MGIGVAYDQETDEIIRSAPKFQPMAKCDYLVGIDPGAFNGLAVYTPKDRKLVFMKTMSFWQLIDFLDRWIPEHKARFSIRFYLEDPNLNANLFRRLSTNGNARKQIRNAQNVGMNKRDAQLILSYLERKGVDVIQIRPSKATATKLKPEQFFKITGVSERTSQHARDAAMLVYGR